MNLSEGEVATAVLLVAEPEQEPPLHSLTKPGHCCLARMEEGRAPQVAGFLVIRS